MTQLIAGNNLELCNTTTQDGYVKINFDNEYKNKFGLSNETRSFQYQSDSESSVQSFPLKLKRKYDCHLLFDMDPIELTKWLITFLFGNKAFISHEAQGFERYI